MLGLCETAWGWGETLQEVWGAPAEEEAAAMGTAGAGGAGKGGRRLLEVGCDEGEGGRGWEVPWIAMEDAGGARGMGGRRRGGGHGF